MERNNDNVTIKDDGLTEKYWDPAWGDEGAAPQGVSYLDPHEGIEESPIYDNLAGGD